MHDRLYERHLPCSAMVIQEVTDNIHRSGSPLRYLFCGRKIWNGSSNKLDIVFISVVCWACCGK